MEKLVVLEYMMRVWLLVLFLHCYCHCRLPFFGFSFALPVSE
jgi:hypothetical protein